MAEAESEAEASEVEVEAECRLAVLEEPDLKILSTKSASAEYRSCN